MLVKFYGRSDNIRYLGYSCGGCAMDIKFANSNDLDIISNFDKHISKCELQAIIKQERVFIAEDCGEFCGWLRYNLFWDNTPFMNMIFVLEPFRGKGIGKELTLCWENKMKTLKYNMLMTSTMSNEYAQHFYRKLGYIDAGSLLLPNEPLEIIFIKNIS